LETSALIFDCLGGGGEAESGHDATLETSASMFPQKGKEFLGSKEIATDVVVKWTGG
jgi:hypothetical protein